MFNLLIRLMRSRKKEVDSVSCIHQIQGGLGNQMFQYAFALAHNAEKEVKSAIDVSFYNHNSDHNGWEIEQVFDLPDKFEIISAELSATLLNDFDKKGVIYNELDDAVFKISPEGIKHEES